jgi:hypothetical protein
MGCPKEVSDFSALDGVSQKLLLKLQNIIKDKTQEAQELNKKYEKLLAENKLPEDMDLPIQEMGKSKKQTKTGSDNLGESIKSNENIANTETVEEHNKTNKTNNLKNTNDTNDKNNTSNIDHKKNNIPAHTATPEPPSV